MDILATSQESIVSCNVSTGTLTPLILLQWDCSIVP